MITYDEFRKVDLRVGTIIKVEYFPEAKKPAYKLMIDFGELGTKKSSAQVCDLYEKSELLGKQVLCVVNFAPKQIGPFVSEVLTTGCDGKEGVVLMTVDKHVQNGQRLY